MSQLPQDRDPAKISGLLLVDEYVRRHAPAGLKIGRCAADDYPNLRTRDEYKSATDTKCLFRGSASECEKFEIDATSYAQRRHPKLCRNQQLGGGPRSESAEHVVYAVFF